MILHDPGLPKGHSAAILEKCSNHELATAIHGCMVGITTALSDIHKLLAQAEALIAELARRQFALCPRPRPDPKRYQGPKTPIPVRCIETGQEFSSAGAAERALNISNVSQAIKHRCKAGPYTFERLTTEPPCTKTI